MKNERIATFQNRLCEAMRINGINSAELAKRTGYSKPSISQWVNGKHEAMQDGVYKLAKALNVNEAWLMGFDVPIERITEISLQQSADWDNFDFAYNRNGKLAKEVEIYERVMKQLPFFNNPVSAGQGQWLGEGHEYELEFFDNPPDNADFALRVRGDSMSPNYNDGDIVFIKAGVIVESGHIGVFVLNGEGYLKMLRGNKLISLNDEYKPIEIKEWDSFFCVGRIVGKVES